MIVYGVFQFTRPQGARLSRAVAIVEGGGFNSRARKGRDAAYRAAASGAASEDAASTEGVGGHKTAGGSVLRRAEMSWSAERALGVCDG